ncbi:MotA/TolQ/ExbB proton channel family protein [Cysteiniphilum halobium]|uniref:MotA/TolQ/ExbB proton channel family protein n=1 Tax=Cysteiniphilum halobium TaxID=2219059 RepID=UPI000E64FADB|nr:MotA/TolQ/ExbB proton channel family protein [Cysteiniphilum halobium]
MGHFFSQFGLVSYAMLAVSFLIVAICIERVITFISLPKFHLGKVECLIHAINRDDKKTLNVRLNTLTKPLLKYISPLVLEPKEIAESEVCLLMRKQRQRMQRPLIWLNLFAVASPMLGLLGTIWSMSHSFAALAESLSGNGLQNMIMYLSEAMYATAFGIILALVSLLAFYCFRQFSERYLANAEDTLNQLMLSLDRQKARKKEQKEIAEMREINEKANRVNLRTQAVL